MLTRGLNLWPLAAVLAFAACDADSRSGTAPVWARGPEGLPVRWAVLRLSLCLGEPPRELGMSYGGFAELVENKIASWELEDQVEVGPCLGRMNTSENGVNSLVFSSSEREHSAEPYGRTVLYTRRMQGDSRTEEIIEADVELYGAAISAAKRDGLVVLESILSHELGHMWGLRHPCSFAAARAAWRMGVRTLSSVPVRN